MPLPLLALIPFAIKAAAGVAIKVSTAAALKGGAAAVGKAAAGAALKAGASKAAAATVAKTITTVTLAGEVGTVANLAVLAHGKYQVWRGGQIGEQAKEKFATTKHIIDANFAESRRQCYQLISEIESHCRLPLTLYNVYLDDAKLDVHPAVRTVLKAIEELPQPDHLRPRSLPVPTSLSDVAGRIYTPEVQRRIVTLTHVDRTQHSHYALYYAAWRPFSEWMTSSFQYWNQAGEFKASHERHYAEAEKACEAILRAHKETLDEARSLMSGSRAILDNSKKLPAQLANSRKSWLLLSESEKASIVALKTAHDKLLYRLRACVQEVAKEPILDDKA